MQRHRFSCIDGVVEVATLLGDLADEVVFVGGSATALLINDPAIPDVRPTIDIDVIVEIASRRDYYRLQESLQEKGFGGYGGASTMPLSAWLHHSRRHAHGPGDIGIRQPLVR